MTKSGEFLSTRKIAVNTNVAVDAVLIARLSPNFQIPRTHFNAPDAYVDIVSAACGSLTNYCYELAHTQTTL